MTPSGTPAAPPIRNGQMRVQVTARRTLHSDCTWPMTEQVTTTTPEIVDGAVELPDIASLESLVDWEAMQRLAG